MAFQSLFNLFRKKRRVAIIGLDCAAPELVFERFIHEMPTLSRLRARGIYGELESVIPAITVPAWSCMMSGKDPGTLGIYGFRNRKDHSYDGLTIANGEAMHEPRLWDILSQQDKHSIVLGVPMSYPPYPINGEMVGCFLTPDTHQTYTYPPELGDRIRDWVGDYMTDVKGFRTEDKGWLLERLHEMTKQRFEVARRLTRESDWDFFVMVEIGLDRIHHGFWKDMDSEHRFHDPNSLYRDAIRNYHALLDNEISELIDSFDDQTAIFIVSDHGAKKMDGGICLNEWLIREGYLVLREQPDTQNGAVVLDPAQVDWSRTRAWGDGGYYGRVFINLEGREPQGIVPPDQYESLRDELIARLSEIGDEHGQPIGTRCFKPEIIYQQVKGVAPDVLVYFGDLSWRSIGTIGWGRIHVFENDTGPDDANHDQMGMFLYYDPKQDLGGRYVSGLNLLQVAPTVLKLFDLPIPEDMHQPPIAGIV